MTAPSEEAKKVAFLGPENSYTHQATLKKFPQEQGYVLVPCDGIAEVFRAVRGGSVGFGVVPAENSTNGIVNLTFSLFAEDKEQHDNAVGICGEAYVSIHHYLLGFRNGSASERIEDDARDMENDLSGVEVVYSHSQVWSQCGSFLSTHLNNALHHSVSSTAEAAHLVSGLKSKSCAAISSLAAGQACQLDVLARKIEDREDNQTRFFVLRRLGDLEQVEFPRPLRNSSDADVWKTLVNFTLDPKSSSHDFSHALAVFGQHGVNVININSLPSGQQPWHYTFFVELEGHKEDPDVQSALTALKSLSIHYKWYGDINVGQRGR